MSRPYRERIVVSAAAAITLLSGMNGCSAGPTGPVGDETASQGLSASGPTASCYCKIGNIATTRGGGDGETPRRAPLAQKWACEDGYDYSHSTGSYWSVVPGEYISTGDTGATGTISCTDMEGVTADVDSIGRIRSQLTFDGATATCGPFAPQPGDPPPPIGLPEPEWVFTGCTADISI